MPASKSFQSYLGSPSPELLSGLSAVLERSEVAKDAVRPDLLASDFLIIAALVDSASISRSSAVILRLLLGFSQARPESKPESRRRVSSSCCLRRRRFEKEMMTSVVQAPSVKSAATAASIIHTQFESVADEALEVESVSASGDESRGVRVKRTEGIVADLAQLAGGPSDLLYESMGVYGYVRMHTVSPR